MSSNSISTVSIVLSEAYCMLGLVFSFVRRSLRCRFAWFGLAWLPAVCEKCGFPLAEERKRRKTFFSHMTGSLGSSVWGGLRSRETFVFTLQLLSAIACHPPPAHP